MEQLLTILLQEQAQEGGSAWSGMIMIVAMIVIFYFFMIRPQNKKQKELKKAREAMKKGDKVVTAGGIHGRIKDLKDTYVMLEIAPNVNIKIDKASVFAAPAAEASTSSNSKKEETVSAEEAGADLDVAAGKTAQK